MTSPISEVENKPTVAKFLLVLKVLVSLDSGPLHPCWQTRAPCISYLANHTSANLLVSKIANGGIEGWFELGWERDRNAAAA